MTKEAETLAIHSLLTVQNTEAIKKNLRNVQKQWVFAQQVTYRDSLACKDCAITC